MKKKGTKIMKRVSAVSLAAVMAAMSLTGCGKGEDNGITWLASSNAEQLKAYQNLMSEFSTDTGIEGSVVGVDNGQMYAKMQSLIAANQTPEINTWGTEFVPWASRGAMTPLDEYIEKDNFDTSIFNESMYKALSYDGKQWEFPCSTGVCVMFYVL